MPVDKSKQMGQVFTPHEIVCRILDEVGYFGAATLDRPVLEPSFGQGIFLTEIAERIIAAGRHLGLLDSEIAERIDDLVWGIELDGELFSSARDALISSLAERGFSVSLPHLILGDALDFTTTQRFGWVVGNPPYVRIHNVSEEGRRKIARFDVFGGVSDLYLIFFEVGTRLLDKGGKLGYITPNSFLRNSTQRKFRSVMTDEGISKIIDFGARKVFPGVGTYTAITVVDSSKPSDVVFVKEAEGEAFTRTLDRASFAALDHWGIVSDEDEIFLQRCLTGIPLSSFATAQYGVQTSADKIFLTAPDSTFDEELSRPVVKASTYKGGDIPSRIIFPYRKDDAGKMRVVNEAELASNSHTYAFLSSHAEALSKRDIEKGAPWYAYGRSQGIEDMLQPKLVVGTTLAIGQTQAQVHSVPADAVVYAGVFITAGNNSELDRAQKWLRSPEFARYARLVGKDMSGGYKSITAKQINQFCLPE